MVGGHSFVTLAAGNGYTCGLTASGTAYCWGWNEQGQLGIGQVSDVIPEPVAVSGNALFKALSAWWDHTCALTADGDVYCWGFNASGEVGPLSLGEAVSSPYHVQVSTR